jgi:MFS-type transporter involved in bile tolerance (Atg22 family)
VEQAAEIGRYSSNGQTEGWSAMSGRTKVVVGGVVIGLLTLFFLPTWISFLIIVAAIALPVAGYLMLDPSQRRKLNRVSRKRLG